MFEIKIPKIFEEEEEGKNHVIALLLCLFFGGVGAHRFYVGKYKSALVILALCLAGFISFGITSIIAFIWVLIDFICICFGKFKTSDGEKLV